MSKIMVGAGTVCMDDPGLTVRHAAAMTVETQEDPRCITAS
jgi:riboflavin biosynthesis pyrimidine reductase